MAGSKTQAISAAKPHHGLPASAIDQLAVRTGMRKDVLLTCLDISQTAKANTLLPKVESERVLGLEALIDMLQIMVEESGNPRDFDAARALSGWLMMPLPALGGAVPASYLNTLERQKQVAQLLSMMQSGAYA